MKSGFHQIEIKVFFRQFNVFVTPDGHYEYNLMPFGFANAPACYQRAINKALGKLKDSIAQVYLDDVTIASETIEKGLNNLRQVLGELIKAGFTLNWEKCTFLASEIEYLGTIVGNGTIKSSHRKIEALTKTCPPKDIKGLRQFMGLTGYFRGFIKGFSILTAPISQLFRIPWVLLDSKLPRPVVNLTYVGSGTGSAGVEPMDLKGFDLPKNIRLADPNFHKPKPIDMIIGVDLFWDLFCKESQKYSYLHKTKLGYVISGKFPYINPVGNSTLCNLATISNPMDTNLNLVLKNFWEIEECPQFPALSSEERACEKIFSETIREDENDRFIVTIPFKGSLDSLGESFEQAERRFFAMERKFERNPTLKDMYVKFMQDYLNFGHMTKVVDEVQPPKHVYYLPHHGVLKTDSLTTKLRVVFDGSAVTSTGISINDVHMTGPTIQAELFSAMLRFRIYSYVVGADVSMMYRQILVEPQQRSLQRILWRADPTQPVERYELNTVTYGLTLSSFLAIRCLFQVADEVQESHPETAEAIRTSFYVDDFLYGVNSIPKAVQICADVSQILSSVGFPLRKWISNDPRIIEQSTTFNAELPCHTIDLGANKTVKTLGLSWNSQEDNLTYNLAEQPAVKEYTKRAMLSIIAKIFDPLGILDPCTVNAKTLLQQLWRKEIDWDEKLPPDLSVPWHTFIQEVPQINRIAVPRFVSSVDSSVFEIHVFYDASERAYRAAIYICSINVRGTFVSHLLCAKSRVAPVSSLTIPRLKLCAAQLSPRLMNAVVKSINLSITGKFDWCDSTIVLTWIRLEPSSLKTCVRHRVAEIQSLSSPAEWHHVVSQENPADLLSQEAGRPNSSELEMKAPQTVSVSVQEHSAIIPFERFSSLPRLRRVMAYVWRFIKRTRYAKNVGALLLSSIEEIYEAMHHLIRVTQAQCFQKEIEVLPKKQRMPSKSPLSNLNPFMDPRGVLRVGGRLENSDFDFDKHHLQILPVKHPLT
ncbi:uncharacterized protein [Euwallacea fornicatus]|uniref:uncharacterized protein n=1 Tax=Euwallacea fornicatus TaxID=995702 RepID=UPI00338F2008